MLVGDQVLTYQDLATYFNAKKNVSMPQIFVRVNRDADEVELERSRSRESSLEVTFGLKVRVNLVRTRNPGRAIVEEALQRGSDLIYISTEHAPSDERLLGPTTRYLLAKRPCRVIIEGGEAAKRETPSATAVLARAP